MEGLRNFGGRGFEHPKTPLGTPLLLGVLYGTEACAKIFRYFMIIPKYINVCRTYHKGLSLITRYFTQCASVISNHTTSTSYSKVFNLMAHFAIFHFCFATLLIPFIFKDLKMPNHNQHTVIIMFAPCIVNILSNLCTIKNI